MSMLLRFTKMHGLGNDFVVIDAITQDVDLSTEQIRFIADRHRGIGCDQVLLIEAPQNADVDFHYRIFNSDGGEVQQCGNGARCFAKYVSDKHLTGKRAIRVSTCAGILTLHIAKNNHYTVDMGEPIFEPANIPFNADAPVQMVEGASQLYRLSTTEGDIEFNALSMGNPHAVIVVDDIDSANVDRLGPLIESHPAFPERVNVGFMQIVSPKAIALRVYERGAGETQACGSGACAAVVAGRLRQKLEEDVEVTLLGGKLQIGWQGQGHAVMMTGSATKVFDGKIRL